MKNTNDTCGVGGEKNIFGNPTTDSRRILRGIHVYMVYMPRKPSQGIVFGPF